jgi:hypothetical protein
MATKKEVDTVTTQLWKCTKCLNERTYGTGYPTKDSLEYSLLACSQTPCYELNGLTHHTFAGIGAEPWVDYKETAAF